LDSEQALPRQFFERDPAFVARELLGKSLIRRIEGGSLGGVVVETEAYYGLRDPASRAFRGKKDYNRLMWGEPGRVFVYNVHRYWMFNVVAHEPGEIGAVLIRALEPTRGLDAMLRNRPVEDHEELTSGPGKLTIALGIDRGFHGMDVTDPGGQIIITDEEIDCEIGSSRRIGVTRDLDVDLRFYVKGSPYVSR
jgi:DNA-3-methyladenine glycosylase